MKFLHLILIYLASVTLAFTQTIKPNELVQKKMGSFEQVDILQIDQSRNANKEFKKLKEHALLSIDLKSIEKLPQAITMKLPVSEKQNLDLELVEVNIFSDDHLAIAEPSGELITSSVGKHYRGIIRGESNSLVAVSFYDNEVAGFISDPRQDGNYVLGRIKDQDRSNNQHIIYLDENMTFDHILSCSTPDEGEPYTDAELREVRKNGRALTDCVRLLMEVDYNLHQELGSSTTASNNYLNTLFNQVATIYAAESINTTLSASFVWTSASPYSGTTTGALLSSYQSNRNNFNADFAHLLSFQNIGGRAATINGVCKTENDRMCVSGVVNSLETVPTYSFDVQIAAHEFGHLFGSFHTHGCYWNGNNTQIDDCGNKLQADRGQTPEGFNCYNSNNIIYPNNGGTIMSYCYGISGVGVNFSNGFGTQPGNAIRNRVSNGTCLQSCGGGGGCTDNELELTIRTDNYPGETTWTVKNGGGTTIASGGSYGSANTTYTESICVPDGCYTFTINDTYGDGICCQYGNGSYTLRGSNGSVIKSGGSFGNSESTNFCEGSSGGGSCVEVNFNDYSISSYGGNQDAGTSSTIDNGAGIAIFDNAWKSIALNYTITPNTKISFQFGSTAAGEIHGLGFDTDNGISSGRTFQLYGNQNWGNRDFDYTSPGNWQSFTIPVGQYYTGSFNRLFFVADHDGGARNGNTYVRNIQIYEGSACNSNQGLIDEVVQRNGFTAMVDGLPDEEYRSNLSIYPNPASDVVNVSFDSDQAGKAEIEILNLLGQRVKSVNVEISKGNNQYQLESFDLQNGSYFIKFSTEHKDRVEKLTIARK